MALRGLEARQVAFSYAYAFSDKTFSVGVTGKIHSRRRLQRKHDHLHGGGSDSQLRTTLGKPTISTAFGIDVGAIYRPSSWLRFGVVAKDINQPTFDAPGGEELKLSPQVRGGVAVNPYSSLTLTADVDATSNKTFVPGVKSQVLSLGVEQTILSEFLSFRVGAFKNMKDAGITFHPDCRIGPTDLCLSSGCRRRIRLSMKRARWSPALSL